MIPHVEIDRVNKFHERGGRQHHTLRNVNFHVTKGEFICIVGPSGCGKSTLLKILAGLDSPSSGEVRFEGRPVRGPHPKVTMVFQGFGLFPWRTVLENVEYGLEIKGTHRNERREIAGRYLELVGLSGYEHMYPKQLSGGMKQRVGIARALVVQPEVVLMDEPFSAIDEVTAELLREELTEIHKETEKTFILVTHNVLEAIYLADRIFVMSSRPGQVKKVFNVDTAHPRDTTQSSFLSMHSDIVNLLKRELQRTVVRSTLKSIPELQALTDMEAVVNSRIPRSNKI